MCKEPIIGHSYQFPNVQSHEWHHWKVDDGSSILSDLVVKIVQHETTEILCDDSYWFATRRTQRRVIMMITTEADNNKLSI